MAKPKYDTQEKRIRFLKKRGNIVTFKEQFFPNGTANPGRTQILVGWLEKAKTTGHVKLVGQTYDTPWFDSIERLSEAVDWDRMEAWH